MLDQLDQSCWGALGGHLLKPCRPELGSLAPVHGLAVWTSPGPTRKAKSQAGSEHSIMIRILRRSGRVRGWETEVGWREIQGQPG